MADLIHISTFEAVADGADATIYMTKEAKLHPSAVDARVRIPARPLQHIDDLR